MKQWYIKGKQKNYGPYSSEQIIKLLDAEKIKLSSLISLNQSDWVRVEKSPIIAKQNPELSLEETKPTELKTQNIASSSVPADDNGGLTFTLAPLDPEPKAAPDEQKSLPPEVSQQTKKTHNATMALQPDNVTPTTADKQVHNHTPTATAQSLNASHSTSTAHAENHAPPPSHQTEIETETDNRPVMYNDLYMIALVLLPLLIAGGLMLGFPKSILGLIFSVVALGLVYVDREALKKLDFEPPHWAFALLPPMYLKQREKIQENPYFFTLSTIASLALSAVVFMYGTNETSDYGGSDDLAYDYETNDPIINDLKAHNFIEKAGRKTVVAVYFVNEPIAIIDDNYELDSLIDKPKWQPRIEYLNPTFGDEQACGDFNAWRMISKNTLEFKALDQSENRVFSSESFYNEIQESKNTCIDGTVKAEIFKDGSVILGFNVKAANDMMLFVYGSSSDDESMVYDLSAGSNTFDIMTNVSLNKSAALDNYW